MYKTTSDKTTYLQRVASHSTKEHKTGRIDMIPAWAREPEDYYNTVRDRWSSLSEQIVKCETELHIINEKLKIKLPFKEYEFFLERQRAERTKYNSLHEAVSEYRMMARAASEHSVAAVFFELAKKQLDQKTFLDLLESTKIILGRPLKPIAMGRSEMPLAQKAHLARREKAQKKRHRYLKKRYGEAFVVQRSIVAQQTGSTRDFDIKTDGEKP